MVCDEKEACWTEADLTEEYNKNKNYFIGTCSKILYSKKNIFGADEYTAESIIYDAYLKILRKIKKGKSPILKGNNKSLTGYIARAIVNCTLNYYKKESKYQYQYAYVSDEDGELVNPIEQVQSHDITKAELQAFTFELLHFKNTCDIKDLCNSMNCCGSEHAKLDSPYVYIENAKINNNRILKNKNGAKIENPLEIGVKILLNDKKTKIKYPNSHDVDNISYEEIEEEYNISRPTFDHIKDYYKVKLKNCLQNIESLYINK